MNSARKDPISTGPLFRPRLLELRRLREAVLVELRLQEAERQTGAPDLGHRSPRASDTERADVVLVRVREQHGADPVASLPEVREVREDEIDAEVLVARESEARVDDDDLAVRLVDHEVLPDLAQAPERRDPHREPSCQVSFSPCRSAEFTLMGAVFSPEGGRPQKFRSPS